VLLGHPSRTALDFRLLSQVEVGASNVRGVHLLTYLGKLNSIRGRSKKIILAATGHLGMIVH
jgi:hypothetical protein